MKSKILGLLAAGLLCGPIVSQAAIIYESATMGLAGQTGGLTLGNGDVLGNDQILGSRFSLSSATNITAIGGNIGVISGTLFGAIVSLDNPDAFPVGTPVSMDEVLASTTFSGERPSADLSIALSVTLGPGNYAVIFGSGFLGASGSGIMPTGNLALNPSNFFWFNPSLGWRDSSFLDTRFVVYGDAVSVPEPGTLALLGLGLVGIGLRRRIKAG